MGPITPSRKKQRWLRKPEKPALSPTWGQGTKREIGKEHVNLSLIFNSHAQRQTAGLAWFELVRHVAETTWHIIRFHVMSQKDVRYWTSMPWSIDTCQVIYPLTDSITRPYRGLRFRAHWNHVLFWSWPWARNYRFFRLDCRLKTGYFIVMGAPIFS